MSVGGPRGSCLERLSQNVQDCRAAESSPGLESWRKHKVVFVPIRFNQDKPGCNGGLRGLWILSNVNHLELISVEEERLLSWVPNITLQNFKGPFSSVATDFSVRLVVFKCPHLGTHSSVSRSSSRKEKSRLGRPHSWLERIPTLGARSNSRNHRAGETYRIGLRLCRSFGNSRFGRGVEEEWRAAEIPIYFNDIKSNDSMHGRFILLYLAL